MVSREIACIRNGGSHCACAKHVQTGHPQSAHRQPLKVEDVIERPPAIWDKAVWDLSRWGDAVGGVTIKNDHERDLLEIVKRAAEFLRASICDEPAGLWPGRTATTPSVGLMIPPLLSNYR